MNILLQTLLLLGGINLIAARYINFAPQRRFEDDLFGYPFAQYNHGVRDYRRFHNFFDDYSEENVSKEPVISETSDELDAKLLRDLESLLSTMLGGSYDDNVNESKITDASKEITNEKNDDDKSDNDYDNDDKNEKNDDDKSDNDDDNDDKNEKNDDDKSDNDDDKNDNDDDDNNHDNDDKNEKDAEDKNDDDDNNNNDDNDTKEDKEEEEDEIIDNSNEEIPVKPIVIADELLFLGKSSEESNETLTVNQGDNIDDDKVTFERDELSEKEIRELTAFLVTLSTMEDLLKVAEHINDEDNSQDTEELFEQKLKEVDNFMGLFVNTLDAILEETSEVGKDTEKSKNDDDNDNDKDDKDDSKDDNDNDDNDNDNDDDDDDDDDDKKVKEASAENNNNEDASVSVEFHSIDTQTNTQNMDSHKYNLVERSTTIGQDFKPTSSPYTPELYSSAAGNPNAAIIHEYVEKREQLDALEENLLTNKLNMDRDFYHIIANQEGDDKNLQKFDDDIAAMRENIFKMKQNIDAIQDVKSKIYFHQLIKLALKDAQIN